MKIIWDIKRVKKIVLLLLMIIITTFTITSCKKIDSYEFVNEGFETTVIYDKDNKHVDLEGLYILSDGQKIPVTYDMVVSGGETNSVGLKEVSFEYHGTSYKVNYTVYYKVDYIVNGQVFDSQFIIDKSELKSPIETPNVDGFVKWEEAPEIIDDNISIDAIIRQNLTPDMPNLREITATYGDKLGDITLPSNNIGKWIFVDSLDTLVGNVGKNSFKVKFIPQDSITYKEVESEITINVSKKELNIIVPTTSYIYTGEEITLDYEIEGVEDINVNTTGIKKTDVGTYLYSISINDPNYSGEVFGTWQITPATITINVSSDTISYDKIGSLKNPTFNIEGDIDPTYLEVLEINVKNPTNLNVGVHDYIVEYKENPNINVVVNNGTLTISKGDITADLPTTIDLFYGDTLTKDSFNAVNGGYWQPKEDVFLDKVGDIKVIIEFVPTDSANYESYETEYTIKVNKKKVEINILENEFIYNGLPQNVKYEILGLVIPGEKVTVNGNNSKIEVGNYLNILLEIESDKYEGSKETSLIISKADPIIEKPILTARYSEQLNSIDLPEGFSWKNPNETIKDIGEQTYLAIYTPNDTKNYNVLYDVELIVNVNKQFTSINTSADNYLFLSNEDINLGSVNTSNDEVSLTTLIKLNGEVVEEIKQAGLYQITYSVEETNHYLSTTKEVIVYVVDMVNVDSFTYIKNYKLSDIKLPKVEFGSWSFIEGEQILNAGINQEFEIKFMVNDSSLYKQTSIYLTIYKAEANIKVNNDNFTYNGKVQKVDYSVYIDNNEVFDILVNETNISRKDYGSNSYTLLIDDQNYEGIKRGTITINKAKITITAESDEITYNPNNTPNLGYNIDGTIYNDDKDLLNIYTSLSPEYHGAGNYEVIVNYNENSNYEVEIKNGNLIINKADLKDVSDPTYNTLYFGSIVSNDIFNDTEHGTWTIAEEIELNKDNLIIVEDGLSISVDLLFTPKDDNYNELKRNVTLNVLKKKVTIKVTNNIYTYDGNDHTLTISVEGISDESLYTIIGNITESSANEEGYDATISIDSSYLDAESVSAKLIINKADPEFEIPTNLSGTYNEKLETVTFIDDNFSWLYPDTILNNGIGQYPFEAKYKPDDLNNYNKKNISINVKINKRTDGEIKVAEDSLTFIYNGSDFSALIRNNVSTTIDGNITLSYSLNGESVNEIKNIGTYIVTAKVLDSKYYEEPKAKTFEVIVIEGGATEATYYAIYGQTLSNITIVNGSDGIWSWKEPNKILDQVGEFEYTIEFKLNGSEEVSATSKVTVIVNPKKVTIEANSLKEVYDSEAHTLTKPTINGLIDGDDESKYTIITSGTTSLINVGKEEVTYSLDSDYYEANDKTVTIEITKAPLNITINPINSITYGENIPELTYNLGDTTNYNDEVMIELSVDGHLNEKGYLNANSSGYTIKVDYSNDSNYEIKVINDVKLVVNKADLMNIETPTLNATYGDFIKDIKINNNNSNLGEWAIVNEDSQILNMNINVDLIFNPKDSTNYNNYELKGINVVVDKRQLTINVTSNLNVIYSGQYYSLEYEVQNNVDDNYEINITNNNQFEDANTYDVELKVVSDNYEGSSNVTFIINKADPTYLLPNGLEGKYGDLLISVDLPEQWSWNEPNTKLTTVGDISFEATYTPTDTNNYNVLNGIIVKVKVNPTTDGYINVDEYYIEFAGSSSLDLMELIDTNGEEEDITFKVNDIDSDGLLSQPGKYNVVVNLAEATNYTEASATFVVILIETFSPRNATYGDPLSNYLPTSSYGEWNFNTSETYLKKTTNSNTEQVKFAATFTSTDGYTKTFDNVVVINVSKKALSIVDLQNEVTYSYDTSLKTIEFAVDGVLTAYDDINDIKAKISGIPSERNAGTYKYTLKLVDNNYSLAEVERTMIINKATLQIKLEYGSASEIISSQGEKTFVQKYYDRNATNGIQLTLTYGFYINDVLIDSTYLPNVLLNEQKVTNVVTDEEIKTYGHNLHKFSVDDDNYTSYTYYANFDIYIARVTTVTTNITALDAPISEGYLSLDEAIARATAGNYIYVYGDATIGEVYNNLTIANGVELFLPHASTANYEEYNVSSQLIQYDSSTEKNPSYSKPIVNLTITVLSDTSIEINGRITIGGQRSQNGTAKQGILSNGYSELILLNDSKIVVNSNGIIWSVGKISGDGQLILHEGANVYEPFMVMDWRGGSSAAGAYGGMNGGTDKINNIVPFNQYEMHNISVYTIIEKGANYIGIASIYTPTTTSWNSTQYKMVGTGAILEISSGSIVKSYDVSTNKTILTINGNVRDNAGELVISVGVDVPIKTTNLYFGLSHNVGIVVTNGSILNINQLYKMLPGSSFVIEEGGVANLYGELIVYKDFSTNNNYPSKGNPECIIDGIFNVYGHFAGIATSTKNGKLNLGSSAGIEIITKEGYGEFGADDILGSILAGSKGTFIQESYQHLFAYNAKAEEVKVTWDKTNSNTPIQSSLEQYRLERKNYIWIDGNWQINSYDINFISNINYQIQNISVSKDEILTENTMPLQLGEVIQVDGSFYSLEGYYLDLAHEIRLDEYIMPAHSINIYLNWTLATSDQLSTITYINYDGSQEVITYAKNSTVSLKTPNNNIEEVYGGSLYKFNNKFYIFTGYEGYNIGDSVVLDENKTITYTYREAVEGQDYFKIEIYSVKAIGFGQLASESKKFIKTVYALPNTIIPLSDFEGYECRTAYELIKNGLTGSPSINLIGDSQITVNKNYSVYCLDISKLR